MDDGQGFDWSSGLDESQSSAHEHTSSPRDGYHVAQVEEEDVVSCQPSQSCDG